MKIVIVGAGFTGMQLARTLVAEDNAVVLIDNDGWGTFRTEGGNVSVWVRKGPLEDLVVNE